MKRVLLGVLGALLVSAAVWTVAPVSAEGPTKKRLLVITESKGFVHDCVNRKGKPLCIVEEALTELGKKTGDWEAVCSQDSRKDITAENLKDYDAVFFYTTGELPLSDTQKADLLAFVKSGKGFAGAHSATDTLYKWPDYGNLIGAYFDGHPWHQKVKVIVEDTENPATRHLGKEFEVTDEIYQYRAPYSRENLHILMRLDPEFVAASKEREAKGLEGKKDDLMKKADAAEKAGKADEAKKLRQQAKGLKGGIHREDNDCALAWTHEYGKGRVFYTALGHRNELWKDEKYLKLIHGGLRYALGLEKADATPSKK
jgi:uncharacterized protein